MTTSDYLQLPGGDLVVEGLKDSDAGIVSESSLVVQIADRRLKQLGIVVRDLPVQTPELELYRRLEKRLGSGAHHHYNSLIRRIVSFAEAVVTTRRHNSDSR